MLPRRIHYNKSRVFAKFGGVFRAPFHEVGDFVSGKALKRQVDDAFQLATSIGKLVAYFADVVELLL